MKKLISLVLVLLVMLMVGGRTACLADECPVCPSCNTTDLSPVPFTCPLVGNTYSILLPDGVFVELSDFYCAVGPGCRGYCLLKHSAEAGSLFYETKLPFSCQSDMITISGLPCSVTSYGELAILAIDVAKCFCYVVGNKTYCLEDKVEKFKFTSVQR